MAKDCPDHERGRPSPSTSNTGPPSAMVAKVNLLECAKAKVIESIPEVMMTKRDRPNLEFDLPESLHRTKRTKKKQPAKAVMRRPRRKIGVSDLILSRGQSEYSLVTDLGKQTANITFGQLVARCASLRRELRQSVSIQRTREQAAEIQIAESMNKEKAKHDTRSPQVEAIITGPLVEGCMVDGGATVNVMAKWFMDEIGLKPTRPSSLKLKVADQRCIRSLGIITQLPIAVNRISVKVDFQVLGVSKEKGDIH
jgi:hypothetical protein